MARGYYELPRGQLRTYGPPRPRKHSSPTSSPAEGQHPFQMPSPTSSPSTPDFSRPHVIALALDTDAESLQGLRDLQTKLGDNVILECPRTGQELLSALLHNPGFVVSLEPRSLQPLPANIKAALARWVANGGRVLTDFAQLATIVDSKGAQSDTPDSRRTSETGSVVITE